MEVCGSMHIFLTPNQRSWMNAIKNAAAIKPKKKVERPQVMTDKRETSSAPNFFCAKTNQGQILLNTVYTSQNNRGAVMRREINSVIGFSKI